MKSVILSLFVCIPVFCSVSGPSIDDERILPMALLYSIEESGTDTMSKQLAVDRLAWLLVSNVESGVQSPEIATFFNQVEDKHGGMKLSSLVFFTDQRSEVIKDFYGNSKLRYQFLFQIIEEARIRSLKSGFNWPKYTGIVRGTL